MTAEGAAERRCRLRRVEDRLDESLLVFEGQPDHLRVFDTPLCRLMGGSDHEVRYRTPVKLRRPFQKGLEIGRYASFKARGLNLVCDDGNDHIVFVKNIEFTDFPLEGITIYYTNKTILLPGEY